MNRTTLASLLAAVLIPASAHAQSVTFEVCNVGDVGIDVFLARTSAPAATHIRPATCAEVARADEAMEGAYLGLAFTDARGQWGAARRFEGIPYMGVKTLPVAVRVVLLAKGERDPAPVAVLSASTHTQTVQRGNAGVSLPMQLLFQPRLPDCKRAVTGRLTTVGRTTGAVEYATVCENLTYTLKVEALPDTREIYLGAQPVAGTMSSGLDNDRSPKLPVNFAAEQAERRARDTPAAIEWTDLIAGLKLRAGNLRRADSRAPPDRVVPDYFVVRGTVASVDIYERPVDPTTSIMVADVVFRESPDVMFNVCTVRLDILKEVFGADFRTSMVGKAIEVSNVAQATENCRGRLSSISIRLARQIRRAPASRFEPTWRVPVNAPVSREPAPRTAESDARAAAFATSATGIAARAAANAPNAQSIGAGSSAMPFYNLSSEAVNLQIRGYCSEIYSGASPTMAPEILRLRVAQQVAIRAEVQGCVTRVEFAVLASNRKVALRYCFVNNNYVGPGNGDRLSAYDECMNQNDVLSALCTRDLEHRAAYSPNLKGRKCSLDHPEDGEAALLLKGTDENGSPLVPASTAPGLPAPAATLWPPGILERAMATAARTPR